MPNLFPLSYKTDSVTFFERIRPLGKAVFLDSGKPDSEKGRYDILAAQPICSLTWNRGKLSGHALPIRISETDDPLNTLDRLYQHYKLNRPAFSNLPFEGGFIGQFGYDLGRSIEKLPTDALDDYELPEMDVALYPWCILIDHKEHSAVLIQSDLITDEDFQIILSQVQQPVTVSEKPFSLIQGFNSNVSESAYHDCLKRIDDYIHAGDCYQVNFAQRFTAQYEGDPWSAYKTLRSAAPTQFAAFLDYDDTCVLSLSPERFLKVDQDSSVTTQPIKGTRPRGKTEAKDKNLAQELAGSEKDRAENVMIVDLLRNDISRSCLPHSVKVPELFAVESYRNVHHLVSTVVGKLRDTETPVSLLRHCFPGGSITGAPKIRSMEIIDELEPHRRSVYCGSIGYISLSGNMDTSITIRTLLAEKGKIHCWAGGGIVADSISESEYQETFDKVNNLLKALS